MKNRKCRHFCTATSTCSREGVNQSSACPFVLNQPNCPHYTAPMHITAVWDTPGASDKAAAPGISIWDTPGPGGTTTETLEKNVNHPKRYTEGKIECIDALESAVVGKTPEEAICVANVIKYLWRYEEKEPLRSLKSAEWYLKRLISKYEANNAHHG